ncbi:hypothetical protein DUNSADRAFT_1631 [Dunaliella salina]|uniref:Uncharacterized protein n=1 Tax=Dunaliella salina TaxID=3046 RepID=A0ABQ7GWV2_DUNSA|nr:hypothetical protein DUNSADRAFT_1631 [Dunaliella salina]|eukprot:KAF5839086.1 hypothetical protein DUNSADRAFT_1631 [Dunaliella salina]
MVSSDVTVEQAHATAVRQVALPALSLYLDNKPSTWHCLGPPICSAGSAHGYVFFCIAPCACKFFPLGWGDLNAINFHQDLSCMKEWPPAGIKMDKWKEVERGVFDGYGYKVFEGTYKTPCTARMYDALPPESRTGDALGCALHLAATGDQGFSRRLRLARPLLQQCPDGSGASFCTGSSLPACLSYGICSLVHESPFYNARRPQAQRGSKLLRVSDLFVLGYATIYESVCLLHNLTRDGFDEGGLCMTGLSMGGVHACMTAAVYPQPVACTPLLAPRREATTGRSLWRADAGSMSDSQAPLGDMWAVRTTSSSSTSTSSFSHDCASHPPQQQGQQQQHQEQESSPNRVLHRGSAEARVRLKNVLETYTDISRFPLPRCPEAAVLVAADNDGYVSLNSVKELHRHWHGSELRMVSGGHVSAFIMHQDKFRQAIADSLCRLRACKQQDKHV